MANFVELGECCSDCAVAIANDDYTGMDDSRAAEVQAALESEAKKGHWLVLGDYSTDSTWMRCDICDAGGGERWTVWADVVEVKR